MCYSNMRVSESGVMWCFRPMSHVESTPQRLQSLDLLRLGLCILVMVTHARRLFAIDVPAWLTKGPLDGKAGVVLFFVLSGHVLSRSLARTPLSWNGYCKYMIRRAFRLFPAYWVALALTFVILVWLKSDDFSTLSAGVPDFIGRNDAAWGQWFLHLFLVVPGMQSDFALPTVWSLMTEAKVSLLIFPVLGWTLLRLSLWQASGVTALLAAGSGLLHDHVIGTAAYLGIFAIGTLLTRVPERWWQSLASWGWWCILLTGIMVYSCMSLRYLLPSVWQGYYLCAIGAAAIIACVSKWPAMSKRMHAMNALVATDISYGIYLLHYPVLLAFLHLGEQFGFNATPRTLLMFAAMAATVVLAWLMAHTVEIPMARLGRQLSRMALNDPEHLPGKRANEAIASR